MMQMKDNSFVPPPTSAPMVGFVVTADQVDSRHAPDAVPPALAALHRLDQRNVVLPFDRTVGDEVQALFDDAAGVVDAIIALGRQGAWRIGVGMGTVETPLPATTREARGVAYIAAREAIGRARRESTAIALVAAGGVDAPRRAVDASADAIEPGTSSAVPGIAPSGIVGAEPYGEQHWTQAAWRAGSALVVLRALLARRTREGWQAVDLADAGLTNHAIAERLGISDSAASQRLARAQRDEGERARLLAIALLRDARDRLQEALDSGIPR